MADTLHPMTFVEVSPAHLPFWATSCLVGENTMGCTLSTSVAPASTPLAPLRLAKLQNALVSACDEGDARRVRSAIRDGASVNAVGLSIASSLTTPLNAALAARHGSLVEQLLTLGAYAGGDVVQYTVRCLSDDALASGLAVLAALVDAGGEVNWCAETNLQAIRNIHRLDVGVRDVSGRLLAQLGADVVISPQPRHCSPAASVSQQPRRQSLTAEETAGAALAPRKVRRRPGVLVNACALSLWMCHSTVRAGRSRMKCVVWVALACGTLDA